MRKRATYHCKDCRHYYVLGFVHAAHFCWLANMRMSQNDSRTSPPWCPKGHVVPGVPYPTFVPGKDPIKIDPCGDLIGRYAHGNGGTWERAAEISGGDRHYLLSE